MNEQELAAYRDFAKGLARQAGKIMLRYFNAEDIGTIVKEDNSPVTVADTAINKLVIDAVKTTYPDHGVLGEEDSFGTDRDFLWVCDPVDGTIPYSHGAPTFAFSLALVHKGVTLVAVLYDAVLDRLASAAAGQGAWLNDERIKLRDSYPHTGKLLITPEIWMDGASSLFDDAELPGLVNKSLRSEFNNIQFCSTTYSGLLTALGHISGLAIPACSAWDMAAMDLIIREAGGVVADAFGDRTPQDYSVVLTRGMIAARNEAEFKKICDLVLPHFNAAKRRGQ